MHKRRQIPCNLKYGYLMAIVCIVNSIFAYKALVGDFSLELNNGKASDAIIIMSWLGIITLFLRDILGKRSIMKLFPIYDLFFTLYIYCYGQSIPWIWGLSDFYKDLVLREAKAL
ncbi:hypothetical protein ACT7DA_28505 [Bacillus pacificus]